MSQKTIQRSELYYYIATPFRQTRVHSILLMAIVLLFIGTVGCNPEVTTIPENTEAIEVVATEAQPSTATHSPTPQPTDTHTPVPTDTPVPTSTHTPLPSPTATELPAEIIDENGAPMALIPAGNFQMGSDAWREDERPVHGVFLGDFYMDIYEVTNLQFAAFLDEVGNQIEGEGTWLDADTRDVHLNQKDGSWVPDAGYENHPVVFVTWYGAQAFCQWRGARLPTEAEWEKAARGGVEGADYPWGDKDPVCTAGAVNGAQAPSCAKKTAPVGSFLPNGYGLFDMAGNAWEWTADWYSKTYYGESPGENPPGPSSGGFRVLRGGSWEFNLYLIRVAAREGFVPSVTHHQIGFRCALPLK